MLKGSLDLLGLEDVLRLLAGKQASGRLDVVRAACGGTIDFSDGRVLGVVAPADLPAAGEDGWEDAALALVDGEGGEFAFRPDSVEEGTLDLGVDNLLERIDRRRAQWGRVAGLFGSLDAPLGLSPAIMEEVRVTPAGWQVLLAAARGATPRQVATEEGERFEERVELLSDLGGQKAFTTGEEAVRLLADGPELEEASARAKTPAGTSEADPTAATSEADPTAATSEAGIPDAAGSEPTSDPAGDAGAGEAAAVAQNPAAAAQSTAATGERAPQEAHDDDAEVDPLQLLRELVGPDTPPKGRRLRVPTREEQRLRLRR